MSFPHKYSTEAITWKILPLFIDKLSLCIYSKWFISCILLQVKFNGSIYELWKILVNLIFFSCYFVTFCHLGSCMQSFNTLIALVCNVCKSIWQKKKMYIYFDFMLISQLLAEDVYIHIYAFGRCFIQRNLDKIWESNTWSWYFQPHTFTVWASGMHTE